MLEIGSRRLFGWKPNDAIDANRPELAGRSHAGCHESICWFGVIGLKRPFKGASKHDTEGRF
jgi:hypothetical protein